MTHKEEPKHAPTQGQPALKPAHLQCRMQINVAIVGNSGTGKSTLCNTLRGLRRPRDNGNVHLAKTGVIETTMEAKKYLFENFKPAGASVYFWDLPGCQTVKFPRDEYIQHFGLRHYDCVIIVSEGRFTETEAQIQAELKKFDVPIFMVRNKIDLAIKDNLEDEGIEELETLETVRKSLLKDSRLSQVYLLCAKHDHRYDFNNLYKAVLCKVAEARGVYVLESNLPRREHPDCIVAAALAAPLASKRTL